MFSRRIIIILLVCAIPLTTLTLVTVYHFSSAYQSPQFPHTFWLLLGSLAALTSIYALFLAFLMALLNRKQKKQAAKITTLGKTNKELLSYNRDLQSRIDLLSATREVSLILNEDVDFETILKKVLEITAHLSGPEHSGKEAEEVVIFLNEDGHAKTSLLPKAYRKWGKTYFEDELKSQSIDAQNVLEAFEHQRLFLASAGDEFNFTLPLVADRERLGVIKVKTLLEGDPQEKAEQTNQLQRNLQEFAQILALAIKTPSLYTRTITDALTGLFSKRHFFTQLETYFQLARRYKKPAALIMIDIDYFKQINDSYGHPTGDLVLKEMAKLIERRVRATSSAYRYGGEEIAVLLPNTSGKGAHTVAERIRKKIERHRFPHYNGKRIKCTISLGIAQYNATMEDARELVTRADNALYQAKQTGRNKTCIYKME